MNGKLQKNQMTHFVVRWTLGTVLGYTGVFVALFFIFSFIASLTNDRDLGSAKILYEIFILVLIPAAGACVGAVQWHMALQGLVSERRWVIAGGASFLTILLGFGLATYFAGDVVTGRFSLTWFRGAVLFGVIVGSAAAIPQWVVLRQRVHQAWWWVSAHVVGVMVVLFLMTAIQTTPSFPMSLGGCCCIEPAAFGAITGVVLFWLLRHPKDH